MSWMLTVGLALTGGVDVDVSVLGTQAASRRVGASTAAHFSPDRGGLFFPTAANHDAGGSQPSPSK
jgi:hypothetical protein